MCQFCLANSKMLGVWLIFVVGFCMCGFGISFFGGFLLVCFSLKCVSACADLGEGNASGGWHFGAEVEEFSETGHQYKDSLTGTVIFINFYKI